jgi:hypothetical protein
MVWPEDMIILVLVWYSMSRKTVGYCLGCLCFVFDFVEASKLKPTHERLQLVFGECFTDVAFELLFYTSVFSGLHTDSVACFPIREFSSDPVDDFEIVSLVVMR